MSIRVLVDMCGNTNIVTRYIVWQAKALTKSVLKEHSISKAHHVRRFG